MAEPAPINLAKAFGFHSAPAAIVFAAIVFAAIYVPLLAWFTLQCFARPTYVYFIINLFCQIRLAAFVLRAVLIQVDSVGEKLAPLIADEVLFGVGFFSLLYSAYTLVLDIEIHQNHPPSDNMLLRLSKNRHVFRVFLTIAVVLGVLASTATGSDGRVGGTAEAQRKASTVLFLVLTGVQAAWAGVLVVREGADKQGRRAEASFGARNATGILLAVSLLLLVREGFATATMADAVKQNNERFWYPLMAVPEVLVVGLFSVPGLVPRKGDTVGKRGYVGAKEGSTGSLG